MSGTLRIIGPTADTDRTETYSAKRPSLKQLQAAVGGYIETVKVRLDGRIREAYVNEDGFAHRLPANMRAAMLRRDAGVGFAPLVGPLVIVIPDPRNAKPAAEPTEHAVMEVRGNYTFTMAALMEANEAGAGYCIRCGTWRDNCEPDAREYPCEECGENAVYGAEELVVRGAVIV